MYTIGEGISGNVSISESLESISQRQATGAEEKMKRITSKRGYPPYESPSACRGRRGLRQTEIRQDKEKEPRESNLPTTRRYNTSNTHNSQCVLHVCMDRIKEPNYIYTYK